ncbi:FecR family protein [Catenovulum agarivorans]|uniref:FecR family protein n=1 Tax=Catenovulum agarivorans TaxID=1172192 RepID=UPI00031FAD05|nr:FecR domain-containing protein [Catenovulum agarivorans]
MSTFEQVIQNASELKLQTWDWIIRIDGDEPLSQQEKQQLAVWLNESPERKQEIYRINKFWHQTLLTELADLNETPAKQQKTKNWLKFSWAAISGYSVACLCLLSLSVYWIGEQQNLTTHYPATSYATNIGEQQSVNLLDGSKLIIDSNSHIEVKFSETSRDLWLHKGEVHFDVAKDKSRPFNVHALNGRVQAVGTAFNVELIDDKQFNVLVTEGKVAVALSESAVATKTSNSTQPLMQNITYMTAGDYTNVRLTTSIEQSKKHMLNTLVKLSKEEINKASAWQRGELIFTGEPLIQVIEKLKRYTELNIQIKDSELETLKIGGRFELTNIENWLKSLQYNFNLNVEKTAENTITISAKGQE